MTDHELIQCFEAGCPPDPFHHADHVKLAWLYLRRHGVPEVLTRLSGGLRTLANVRGKPDRYHETITLAYLLLINERIASGPASNTWSDFARENADLLKWKGGILDSYYRPEILTSDLARRVFVFPEPYRPSA